MTITNLMTKSPITVGPEDTVVFAAKILADHNFNGLPVVDKGNKLLGIITEYDLISKGTDMHLPTLINVMNNVGIYKNDSGPIKNDLKKLLSLRVKDIMNNDPLSVNQGGSVQELVDLFAHHHRVNPIPVITDDKTLVGIVSRFDLVKLFVDESAHRNVTVAEREITDKKVDQFVNDFEKRFVFISKTRMRLLPVIFFAFTIIGFIIAFAIIVRIAAK